MCVAGVLVPVYFALAVEGKSTRSTPDCTADPLNAAGAVFHSARVPAPPRRSARPAAPAIETLTSLFTPASLRDTVRASNPEPERPAARCPRPRGVRGPHSACDGARAGSTAAAFGCMHCRAGRISGCHERRRGIVAAPEHSVELATADRGRSPARLTLLDHCIPPAPAHKQNSEV